jgi:hypothetical protein
MFSTGITDLAPELDGFYGESGILIADAAAPSTGSAATAPAATTTPTAPSAPASDSSLKPTSIFLVGHHFTALGEGTRIIAGGIDVTATRQSLSREVMAITVPSNAIPIKAADGREYVDVHLATPYGVSSHLLIPAYRPGKAVTQAVDEAIAKHEKNRHLLSFSWEKPEFGGCIELGMSPPIVKLDLAPTVNVSNSSAFDSPAVDFAAWIDVKPEKAEYQPLMQKAGNRRATIRMHSLCINDNRIEFTLDDLEILTNELIRALETGNYQGTLEEIKLTAFIRGLDSELNIDAAPVIKFDNSLTIKVRRCPSCVTCPPQPAAP